MANSRDREQLEQWLELAGVTVNGEQPFDPHVFDDRFFKAIRRRGFVGLADAYVDGWWDCDALDQFYERVIHADVASQLWMRRSVIERFVTEKLFNLQNHAAAARNVSAHYDLGNDLFGRMLDRRMTYSCGYWEHAASLDEAQEAKLELVCQKLGLQPGIRVLDIGCGWGSFVQYAAERYGCETIGITLSQEQAKVAKERCATLPVEIRVQDYRDVDEPFDRIVSIGMLEHVGPKNYRTYMERVERCLDPRGICLLHFFATRRSWPTVLDSEGLWVTKHIFPGLVVPSLKHIGAATDGLFVLEDLQNFGADYDPTLMAWFGNFDRHWPELRENYGDRFYRTWKLYLLCCAGAFRSRKYSVWQLVLSPKGVPGVYQRPATTGVAPASANSRIRRVDSTRSRA